MKITQEHYDYIKNAIAPFVSDIDAMKEIISNDSRVKDAEKRLRWDFTYKAKLSTWMCDNLYSYMNDNHIDTALKSIMKELTA